MFLTTAEKESGHDLGLAARGKLAKSSESILDLAVVIHKAYDLYYVKWAKRGRPKSGKRPDYYGSPRWDDEVEMKNQWEAFLAASGYEMAQHSKLLRNYWRIGRRAGGLRKYSENLPNSVDALAELCAEGVSNEEWLMVMAELNQQHTADDIRMLLKTSRAVPLDDLENVHDLMADYHQSEVKHRFKDAIAQQRQAANSAGLFSIPAIEVTRENMTRVAVLAMVAKHLGFTKATESDLGEDLGQDFSQLHGTLKASHCWRQSVAYWIDYLVKGNGVEPYLEKVLEAA
jgi:hypothetical protein